MGFRFSIEHANWLAHVLQPVGATPLLRNEFEQRETLRTFVTTFAENFYSTRKAGFDLRELIHVSRSRDQSPHEVIKALRDYFQDTPWVALLLSGTNQSEVDQYLLSRDLLRHLVGISPDDPGLILQLQEPASSEFALENTFPAFKTALAAISRWPGCLIWTRTGDAAFFELPSSVPMARESLHWLFSQLATNVGNPDLEILLRLYKRSQPALSERPGVIRLLHLSDLHLGSQIARRRMPRVQALVEAVVRELGEDEPILPVITGDLMDTPTDENLGDVRSFMSFIRGLGIGEPSVVLGNHDVREDGWLNPQLDQAVNISRRPVVWMDEHEIALACFNSVTAGRLARGRIGENEFTNVGNALDEQPNKRHYLTVGVLHHHPIPVERPDWYARSWYERILGDGFERTEQLEDAELFLRWLEKRGIPVALHGHKHIPRFDRHGGIAIVGCGSTVGKVNTAVQGETFMSLNIVELDRSRNMLSCRLRAERIPGAGLESISSHELILRTPLVS